MSKAIYVLGGMGPQASLEFYRLLIHTAQSVYHAKNNDDYPEVAIHSIPVPDFIGDQSQQNAALTMLQQRVKSIDETLFSTLAIACNTAHLLAPALQQSTSLQFVSMIDQVAIVAYQKRVRKIGLLASPTTIKSGLYNAACASFGITVVVPSSEQLNTIEAAIRAVIACTDIHPYQQALRDIAATLIGRGAELIVLGCTELPIAYGETSDETTVSSLRVLSDAVLKQYYEG